MTWHFGISCLHSVVLYQLQKDLHSFEKHTRRSMLSHFENLQIVRRCNCVATREKGRWANGRVRWLHLANHKSANLLYSRIYRKCGNLRICDLRINQKKLADIKICRLAYLRNLGICDCGLRPENLRICDLRTFKKHLRAYLCLLVLLSKQGRNFYHE
jgi:hypothetical protein